MKTSLVEGYFESFHSDLLKITQSGSMRERTHNKSTTRLWDRNQQGTLKGQTSSLNVDLPAPSPTVTGHQHPLTPTGLNLLHTRGGRLLFLVLWLNLVPRGAEGCPVKCVCYSEPRPTVACQQQGLFSIPNEIPVQSQRIFLQSNKLTVVRSTSFSSVHNLTVLWMYSNNISHIEAGAFYGLERLEELDIGDNSNLRIISPTAFRGLSKLHTLHLHRCGLSELPVGAFQGLCSLQYLYLQDNNLLALHDDTFLDLANLTYLFLHNNKIKTVSDHMLRGLINLDRLLLHQNRVIYVQPRAFSDLGKLTTLFLFYNNLTMLTGETMDPLGSLQYLRLNGNQWVCDCRARTLWDWFKRFKGSSSELECNVPLELFGKDLKRLKSDDLEGCVETPQIQTQFFSSKPWSGKFASTENPLGNGIPRCCLTDNDKSSIISGKTIPDPSSYNSRQITNNPLKEKENISKTKFREQERTKNETIRNKQSLNDGPLGTLSNNLDQSLVQLQDLEPSTAPTRKKKKCTKKPKSDAQCLKGHGSTMQAELSFLFMSIIWFWFSLVIS